MSQINIRHISSLDVAHLVEVFEIFGFPFI